MRTAYRRRTALTLDLKAIMNNWDIERVRSYISGQVEESLTLDYKAADSLQSTDPKKREITKDISAMANSAGGLIIYGVREYADEARKHFPERIDPVDRTVFSKETLEHVVNNIRPKIDVIIHPVPVPDNATGVIYIVEIPQSHTAHQALNNKYYKRHNFESVAMEDYEIRDIMFRARSPVLTIKYYGKSEQQDLGNRVHGRLYFALDNKSPVSAKNVVVSICLGSLPQTNRITLPRELTAGASLYRDPIHEHKKIWTSKRDIVHKGLETTAVELDYVLYTAEGIRFASHIIELSLYADDMAPVRIQYRISMSPDNNVSVDKI